jgi:hypothetical protein
MAGGAPSVRHGYHLADLTILTGRNMPIIGLARLLEPSTINKKTIADFTRVVEQTGILEPSRAAFLRVLLLLSISGCAWLAGPKGRNMSGATHQFSIPPSLRPEFGETLVSANEALARLSARRRAEITVTGSLALSKIAWKIETFSEAMLYRLVNLGEGAALGWNDDNALCAMLSARAIVETFAVLLDFEHQLKVLLASKDLDAINALAMNRAFGSRDPDWIKDSPDLQAVNVLTLIDKMDGRLLPGARGHYDRLSERCHPNAFGQHQMFTTTDYETGTVTFNSRKSRRDISAIICGIMLLDLSEAVFDR